ncbi:MAG: sialate O-acetylesterase [Pseudomonadota bacterium]
MIKKSLLIIGLLALWMGSMFYAVGLGGLAGKHAPDMVEYPALKTIDVVEVVASFTGLPGDISCASGALDCGNKDTDGRREVSCQDFSSHQGEDRVAVLFAFGQSNSANFARDRYAAGPQVANFSYHTGKCYEAEDPLLGANGVGGSVWGIVADKLVASGDYDAVLIAPFGIGGTSIKRWVPSGDLHVRVKAVAEKLAELDISPTHILWHQGESDSGASSSMTSQGYVDHFDVLVDSMRSYGLDAPVFAAIATVCNNPGSDAIRAAQRSLPEQIDGVYLGPDTDRLTGSRYRFDLCHFNHIGMEAHARLWLAAFADATPG